MRLDASTWARHTTRSPLVRVRVMADSHRSALRPRGRPRGRHARLIVRCSTREFPVAMGPLRPVWAARRARWSHAISDALAVSRARIRGGRGGRLIGRCLLCSQVRRERSSGGSTRAAHDLDTLHLRGHLRADQRAREAGPGAQVRFPCHGRLARCLTRASPRDSSRKPANGCHAAGSVSRRDVTEHETARDHRPAGKIFWDQMFPERYG